MSRRAADRRAAGHPLTYLHADHLGRASLATTVTGTLLSQRRYLPYGETRWSSSPLPTDRRFTGQREEVTLGVYDYSARFYSPGLGRFLSADTLVPEPGRPQSLNRYSYVLGNPLRYTDPTGHCGRPETGYPGEACEDGYVPGWWVYYDNNKNSERFSGYGTSGVNNTISNLDQSLAGSNRMPSLTVDLVGFRGLGQTAGAGYPGLIQAGHVGVDLGDKVVYAFRPTNEAIANLKTQGVDPINYLHKGGTLPGQVYDDTSVFRLANQLADQGIARSDGTSSRVYRQSISIKLPQLAALSEAVHSPVQSPYKFGRLGVPMPPGYNNCATWPRTVGLPIPEQTGFLANYIPMLKILGGNITWP